MVLFAVVQYNDPDGLFWGVIYGIAALWCGIAAFRPSLISGNIRKLLLCSLAFAALGIAWFWPRTPEFWRQEVWWITETAREGMGMMVVLIALTIAWLTTRARS